MNIRSVALEILKIDAEQRLKWIEEAKRWDFGYGESGSLHIDELFDITLDLLSAPKDEMSERPEFCREWLRDKWTTLLQGNPSDQAIREFIELVHREIQVSSGRVPGRQD